jgi:hypothetical protein
MKIENLPHDLAQMLYVRHQHEIASRIPEPVAVLETDPIWKSLDDLLTEDNLVTTLSRQWEFEFTVHEILAGVSVIWIIDDTEYTEEDLGQAIIIDRKDLALFREGGIDAIVGYHLFKRF